MQKYAKSARAFEFSLAEPETDNATNTKREKTK